MQEPVPHSSVPSAAFSPSRLFYAMRSLFNTHVPYFNRLPAPLRNSLLIGLPACFSAWGYMTYQQRQLANSAQRIQRFHAEVVQDAQDWPVWKMEDRLYSMSDVIPKELAVHREVRSKISRRSEALGRLRNELDTFWLLARLESLQAWTQWGVRAALPVPGSLQDLHQRLDAADAALVVTGDMNHALGYLKKRFYPLARNAAQAAIEHVGSDHLAAGIGALTRSALYAQAYNIAAKVARAQEDYVSCDRHYEEAIQHLQGHPDLSKVEGSRIALWGDLAWRVTASDVSNIKQHIDHPGLLESIIKRFTAEEYSLGLANISWMLIQAAEKADKLGLSAQQRITCLRQTEELAGYAIAFERQDPRDAHLPQNREAEEASSNAWLFRGIARMAQAESTQQADLLDEKSHPAPRGLSSEQRRHYEAALEDFEAGLKLPSGQDHPSLLRRRAMVLEKLGDLTGAYHAYRQAQVELRYRSANQELLGHHPGWLREIEEKLQKLRPLVASSEAYEAVTGSFIAGDYQTANQQLRALPQQESWVKAQRAWFERHFQVEQDGRVIPKARENFLKRLGIYEAPSPYVCMALSAAVYRAKHEQGLGLPAGWRMLYISHKLLPDSGKNGYLAVAFQHIGTRQIIISHGGTDWTDPEDLMADASLSWGKDYPQLADAQRFTQRVMQEVAAHRRGDSLDSDPPAIIYHTGHSLGGALAAYLACTSAPIGSHYAVTFDNPSSYWQISRQLHQDAALPWYEDSRNFPVTSYLVRPTFINCAGGPHLGRIMRLQVDPVQAQDLSEHVAAALYTRAEKWVLDYLKKSIPGLPAKEIAQWIQIAKANIACHGSPLLLSTFVDSDKKPEQPYRSPIHYVLAWPQDLSQWQTFEESLQASHLSADAILHHIPPEAPADDKQRYRLRSSQPSAEHRAVFRESIPLEALEPQWASLLQRLLKDGPMTPAGFQRLLDQDVLTPTQRQLAQHIDSYVLSCLQLNPSQDQLLLKGALSSWELFTYLRQQVQEACQTYPELTVAGILYPDLEHLPGQMRAPARPPRGHAIGARLSGDAAEQPALAFENKEHQGEQKRTVPTSYGAFGAFFRPAAITPSEHKTAWPADPIQADILLKETYDLLDQVYPPCDAAHTDSRKAYLLRLSDLQQRRGHFTPADYTALEQLQTMLQQQQAVPAKIA